jgi:putative oxidoreductase
MLTWLSQYRDIGLLILRAGIGTMLVIFGWQKLQGGADEWAKLGKAMAHLGITFYPVVWGFLCALTEALGGLLVVVGLWFRPACIALTFNFIVATVLIYKTAHSFQDWSRPGELLLLFFCLIFIGAGKYSVDRS